MDAATLNELITVHLRYTAGARPLRTRAVAQLVAKVLYTLPPGETASEEEIKEGISQLLGIPKFPKRAVSDALALLNDLKLVDRQKSRCVLSVNGKQEIEADVAQSFARNDAVLNTHFPQSIPKEKLRNWFRETCVEYFGRYGTTWAATVCRVPSQMITLPISWQDIIPMIANRYAIDEHKDALIKGFASFMASPDRRDQEHLWSLGQAMFAARLIAAGIGADPITTLELQDSWVFLDTNVLITTSLEASKLAPSVAALGKALESLNTKLMFLPITEDEYKRLIGETRTHTLRVVDRYPPSIIDKATDAFTRTARSRGCNTLEDFERFFAEINRIPTELDGQHIERCEDEEIIQAGIQGSTDEDLQQQVAEVWQSMRRRRKSNNAVIHDSALTTAVEYAITKGQRCWVLTLDGTMNSLSARRSGPHGMPAWITLDALLQVLAFDMAGPLLQAENFGALLASILENDAQPMLDTYTVQDLAWLLDIEERCADLPEDRITEFAMKITRARLSGVSRDDPELQLEIQRAFQGDRLNLVTEVSAVKVELNATLADLESQWGITQRLQESWIKERTSKLRRDTLWRFAGKVFATTLYSIVVVALGIWLSSTSTSEDSWLWSNGLPGALITGGIIPWPIAIFRHISRLKKSLESVPAKAEREIPP